jgi:hypothetical protein
MDGSEHRAKRWGVSSFKGSFPTKKEAETEAHLSPENGSTTGKPDLTSISHTPSAIIFHLVSWLRALVTL